MSLLRRVRNEINRWGILRTVVYAVVFLLLLELASRYYGFGPGCFSYRMMQSLGTFDTLVRRSAIDGLPWEFKPDLRTFYLMQPFVTNAAGLREDRDYSLVKPSDTFRAVVVGASNATGHALERKDMFDKLIERRLNERGNGTRYEFINFAFESYDARKCWYLLEQKALAYHPDLVLFCTPTRGEMKRYPEGCRPPEEGPRRFGFFSCYFWALVKNSVLFRLSGRYESIGYSEEQLRLMDDVYARLSELDIPAVIVILQFSPGDPSETAEAQIRGLAAKHRLPVVNTWPYFDRKLPPGKYLVFRDDPHPNERANGLFADAVAAFLRDHGLDNKQFPGK